MFDVVIASSHFFFSSSIRHTSWNCDWSSDVCSSDLHNPLRGLDGHKVTQLEYARAGIVIKEMIYVAERDNLGRKKMLERAEVALAVGESFGADIQIGRASCRERVELLIAVASCTG